MTPAQCRAARGLLDLTQEDLAFLAGVTVQTLRNFEGQRNAPRLSTKRLIELAIYHAGARFTERGVEMADVEAKAAKAG